MADDESHQAPLRADAFVLPLATRSYRRPAIWSHGCWAYCERQHPTVWPAHRHAAHVQVLVPFDGAVCVARCRSGRAQRWVKMTVPARHVWIVPEGMEHEVEWGREAELLAFYLEVAWVHRLTGERIRDLSLEPLERYSSAVPAIGELGGLMRQHCRTPGRPNDSIVAGLAAAFASQLMVAHFAPRRAASRPHGLALSRSTLGDICAFVEQHLDQKLTLALLAKRAGLSPSYFGQMFRAAMGLSPLAYIIDRRILRALEFLRTGRFTVKEVAHAVGFSDQHQMDYHFARNLENPPSYYLPAEPP